MTRTRFKAGCDANRRSSAALPGCDPDKATSTIHLSGRRIMATQTVAVGKRYGRLMILELGNQQNGYQDRALCECGTVKTVRRADLQSGRTSSCGCLRRENATKIGASARKHGHSRNPLYYLWHTMIARCHNPNHAAYRYYGARGVHVCDRWRESFEAFAADMGARPIGLELDRIDPMGHYGPGNVRWMNRRMQKINRAKRSDHYTPHAIEWKGQTYAISDLAAIAGISYSAMYGRLMGGMSVDAAINKPLRASQP